MSERAAAGDWEGLRGLVDELIAHLRAFAPGSLVPCGLIAGAPAAKDFQPALLL
jgi:hypothetical protein